MSREYIFYPAFKENGKYKALLFDSKGNPAQVFWRSGSFIDGDFFTECPMTERDEFDDKCKEYFGDSDLNEDAPTYIYEISESFLQANAGEGGLVTGYAPLEQIVEYYRNHEIEWMDIIPPEAYSEFPAAKQLEYGKFSAMDYYSSEFICSHLLRILNNLDVPYEWEGEKCYLMLFSF